MPHTSSAKKRLRQTEKRTARNRIVKKAVKVETKKFLAAVQSGDAAAAQAELSLATKQIDKAGAKRVMHPNTAARRKSKLARMLNKLKAKPAATA